MTPIEIKYGELDDGKAVFFFWMTILNLGSHFSLG